ncbi:MAG: NUDIX hydrolase [Verrucomicrobiota bacterium]
MIRPWEKISSKKLGDFRVFSLRSDLKKSPRTGKEHDFFIIDSVNWVNIIAVTPNRELVMIEQFRQGSNTVELEVPGGMMDTGDASPVETGGRELREETGYSGDGARVIGKIFPNPAIMSNTCFTVLIENCHRSHETQFDCGEDIVTRLVPISELPALVSQGKISHALVVVALYHFELWRKRTPASAS